MSDVRGRSCKLEANLCSFICVITTSSRVSLDRLGCFFTLVLDPRFIFLLFTSLGTYSTICFGMKAGCAETKFFGGMALKG